MYNVSVFGYQPNMQKALNDVHMKSSLTHDDATRAGTQGGAKRAQCEVDPYNHTRWDPAQSGGDGDGDSAQC